MKNIVSVKSNRFCGLRVRQLTFNQPISKHIVSQIIAMHCLRMASKNVSKSDFAIECTGNNHHAHHTLELIPSNIHFVPNGTVLQKN